MQSPSISGTLGVDEADDAARSSARSAAHPCFVGARWLLGGLAFSLALWGSFGWGLRALVSAF